MKRSKINICFAILLLFLFSYYLDCAVLHGYVMEDEKWSIDFKNCTVSEALSRITQMSGISIIANDTIDKRISTKSYKDMTIDQILADLLRGQNCAVVWHYSEEGLDSVNIWTFGRSGTGGGSITTASKRSVSTAQSRSDIEKPGNIQENNTRKLPQSNIYLRSSNEYSTVQSKVEHHDRAARETQSFTASSRSNIGNRSTDSTDGVIRTGENRKISSIPEKWNYLEPPPMPPGLSNVK
jgi:hypothetical protein